MQKSSHCGLALVAIIGVTAVLLGCSPSPTPAGAAPTSATKPAETSSQPQAAPADYIASGPIVVENQVELAAQRDGVVAEVLVETGAPVTKGQLLARLDGPQLTADKDATVAKARRMD